MEWPNLQTYAYPYIRNPEVISHMKTQQKILRVFCCAIDFSYLRANFIKHRKIDEQVATLAQGSRHRLVKRSYFDAHTMIGAVVEHRHEIAITTDQYDTINSPPIDEAYHVHTQVEVHISLLRPAGERLVVFGSDTIAQALHRL